MDRLALGCLTSELRGRGFLLSASDSEVPEVNDSLDAELRSFAVYSLLRFKATFSASRILFLEAPERPRAVDVVGVFFVRENRGRIRLKGATGE